MVLGSEKNILTILAPGIVWIAALLSQLMSLENLFHSELEEGTLEQLILSSYPLNLLLLGKTVAHWIATGFPLVVLIPLLGLLLNISLNSIGALIVTLVLGTPILSLVGALVSILTLGFKKSGILLMVCVIPLVIPVLIFGTSAVQYAGLDLPWSGQIALLGALLILVVMLIPLAMSFALKVNLSE